MVAGVATAGGGRTAAPKLRACIGGAGAKPCRAPALGSLSGVSALALSPDGRTLYAGAYAADSVFAFRRASSGRLALLGCVADAGAAGCTDPPVDSLTGAGGLAVSPGGGDLYVTAGLGKSLTRFSTVGGGAPQFAACTASGGAGGCADPAFDSLVGAAAVAVGPGGSDLYVTSFDGGAVTHLKRAPDGSMPTAGCVADNGNFGCTDTPGSVLEGAAGIALDRKGRDVYVTAAASAALVHLRRRRDGSLDYRECWAGLGANGCRKLPVDALLGASGVALSANGKRIFVASQAGTVTSFARAAKSGRARFISCLGDDGRGGCVRPRRDSIREATGIAVAGHDLYVASQGSDAITRVAVDRRGRLDWVSCISSRPVKGCAKAPTAALDGAYAVAARGRSLYAAAPFSGALATLSLPRR